MAKSETKVHSRGGPLVNDCHSTTVITHPLDDNKTAEAWKPFNNQSAKWN